MRSRSWGGLKPRVHREKDPPAGSAAAADFCSVDRVRVFRSGNTELHGFASRLLLFIEQTALDSGKTQLGYLLSGYPDPSPLGFTARRAPGLKTFSRLTPLQWMAANLAYLKDLDYAETRIAQLGTTRPPKPSVPDPRSRCPRGGGQAAKPRIQMQALKGGRGLWFRSCQAGESGQLFLQPGARS